MQRPPRVLPLSVTTPVDPAGVSRLRFSRDGRLRDVIAALDSSHPLLLSGPGLALHEADPDLPAKQQQQLLAAALRTMSLPLGRGAVALATGGWGRVE